MQGQQSGATHQGRKPRFPSKGSTQAGLAATSPEPRPAPGTPWTLGGSQGSDEGISLTKVSQPESSKMKTGKHLLLAATWKADLCCPMLQLPAAYDSKKRLICIRVSWPRDTPDLEDLAQEKFLAVVVASASLWSVFPRLGIYIRETGPCDKTAELPCPPPVLVLVPVAAASGSSCWPILSVQWVKANPFPGDPPRPAAVRRVAPFTDQGSQQGPVGVRLCAPEEDTCH
ncbi:PREDICTED: uncharacterized protein LOC104997263 [Bison bison bison]|uniref:Uncharacterized protein LOC104997263 n=1 Tax=Bison bison bison TaxID=43346 RepID=A0A6P3IEC1_BISBB|nr:PREDICTED: uncharacterized protein LOC104997263 [Bison bison bison]